MKVVIVFVQIIMFPLTIFLLSVLVNIWASKSNRFVSKICHANNFTTISYVVGGLVLFPLYFVFKPVKINGITYLTGSGLWIYWLLSFIVITPAVYIYFANSLYFKKVLVKNYLREALFLGVYSLSVSIFMEIIIYVYWRKTIPSIYDYFFGKNFPFIDINWLVVFISIFIASRLSETKGKRKKAVKHNGDGI
ncbi:MAG: hypothetical protein N2484_07840 [Clostridia bacterium]|nr:hypothetical protein [Clostridia bacterium]